MLHKAGHIPALHVPPGIPDDEGPNESKDHIGTSRRNTSCSDSEATAVIPETTNPFAAQRAKLGDFVDKLEMSLSKCLSEYRSQAEDALSEHLAAVEALQNTYEHDLAALTLENQSLRQKLGMKGFEEVKKVMFQSAGRRTSHSSQPSQSSHPSRRCWVESEDAPLKSPSGHGRKLSISSRKEKIGGKDGSWQVFMAWVPTGSALLQAESWKASEKEANVGQQKVLMSRKKPRPLSHGSAVSGSECASVAPHETEKITLAVDGEESDSDSSGSSRMDHKQEYAVLPVWEASEKLQKKLRKNSRSEAASSAAYKEDEPDFGAETPPWYILNPDSSPRVYWDVLSLAMITYDIIFVPLEVCFTLEETTFLAFLDWFTRLFWTFDMGMSCITGFVFSDGVIEYKAHIILRRYAKTWFLPDLGMVLSDWIGYLVAGSGLGLGQLARAIRMARAVRLLRLLRMQEVLANLTERLQSDVVEIVMQIVKMVVVLVMLCHFIACFWWAIGSGSNGNERTWVKAGAFDELSVDASYLVCLLWAISLFSGGCGANIYPETSTERMYGVVACLCSFVVLLVMLGTLTSGLTQRHIIDGSGQRQMAALKTYLRQNSIPKNLTKRLCRSAKHAISGDLTPDSVQLLTVISEPLKMQMHFEMYSRLLLHHPFFKDLLTEGNQLVRRVCHQAMGILLLTNGDVVFEVEEEPSEPKLYLVASGSLDYTDSYGEVEKVVDKCWIAEPVLWTKWKHRGTLVASSDVKMAMLDATSFQELCRQAISRKNPACLPIIAYALEFVKELNQRSFPTDLPEDS